MTPTCPYGDCAYASLAPDAPSCPSCGRPLYGMAGHDYTALILDRTRDFTGRVWALEAIDRWLADPGGRRVFFVGGEPGSGKTALAARLVRMARGEAGGEPLADGLAAAYPHLARAGLAYYHFCQAQDDALLRPVGLVQSLALALANSYPAYALVLAAIGNSHPEIRVLPRVAHGPGAEEAVVQIAALDAGALPARSAFLYLVAEPLAALAQAGASGPILVLVDALDEALDIDPRDNIAALLGEIARDPGGLPARVRFLVTARPDPRIVELLGPPALRLDGDAPPARRDAQDYAERRLADILPDQAAAQRLAARILLAGGGNLLYARYVLDDLAARPGAWAAAPERPLPQGLDGVYRQFIQGELARSGERWTERYGPLLGLLAAARSPGLTREHLAAASGVSLCKTDDALAALGPFLSGPRPEGPFMLYHASFGEFLLRDAQYRVYPGEAEQALGELFVQAYGEDWAACGDDYALQRAPLHLARAAQALTHPLQRAAQRRLREALGRVLLDYGWMQGRLHRAGIHALLADLALAPPDESDPARKVGRALEESAAVLAEDPAQLGPQLLGRLLDDGDRRVQAFLEQARARCKRPCLLPLAATLRRDHGPLRAGDRHTDRVTALLVTPDASQAVSASADGTLIVWRLAIAPDGRLVGGGEPRTLSGHSKSVYALAVTPDSRNVISASVDRTLRVWEISPSHKGGLPGSRKPRVLEGHPEAVTGVVVTPDGKRAISASADATLRVWDLSGGRKPQTLKGHSDWVTALALSPDGSRLVSASWDNTLRVWGLAPSAKGGDKDGEKLHTLKGHTAHVRGVVVTPDGARAISTSLDHTARLWDLQSGDELGVLAELPSVVTAVALTPDGRYAVCASGNAIKVWDLSLTPDGKLAHAGALATLAGHRALVSCVSVIQDGQYVLSASWDGALKVWSLPSALDAGRADEALLAAYHIGERLTVCAASPDGRVIVVGDESGRVHFVRWEA